MAPYSMDLRVRVMADVDGGMRTTAVAQKYRVSADWIRKLKRLRRETGSFAPRQQRVSHATKLDEDLPRLEQLVAQQPDATLKELRDALGRFGPMVVEREGRITGYLTAPGLWLMNHGIATSMEDMTARLAGTAAAAGPVSLLVPTRQTALFRWCLAAGMRVVMPLTLMTRGAYGEPEGVWFPSVYY